MRSFISGLILSAVMTAQQPPAAGITAGEMVDLALARNAGLLGVGFAKSVVAASRTKQGEGTPVEQALIQMEVNEMQLDRSPFANQVERALLELKSPTGFRPEEPFKYQVRTRF